MQAIGKWLRRFWQLMFVKQPEHPPYWEHPLVILSVWPIVIILVLKLFGCMD
jgi:hypothetical protein